MMKKLAGTRSALRMSRILGVNGLGPSSNVSATTFSLRGPLRTEVGPVNVHPSSSGLLTVPGEVPLSGRLSTQCTTGVAAGGHAVAPTPPAHRVVTCQRNLPSGSFASLNEKLACSER